MTMTYQAYTEIILQHLNVRCGDVIELRLASRNITDSPPETAIRAVGMFTRSFGLIPEQLAVGTDHFGQLAARAIDVIWNPEEGCPDCKDSVDGVTIPVKIPYVLDASLPGGTVAARLQIPLCPKCKLLAGLVGEMQGRGFAVTEQEPGTITMTRLEAPGGAS